jgi:hypothetical protein
MFRIPFARFRRTCPARAGRNNGARMSTLHALLATALLPVTPTGGADDRGPALNPPSPVTIDLARLPRYDGTGIKEILATHTGPLVGRTTDTSAVINLVTAPGLSRAVAFNLAWATNPSGPFALDVSREQVVATPLHPIEFELSNLAPDTRYHCAILLRDPADAPESMLLAPPSLHAPGFRTAPTPGSGTTRFVVFADAHDNLTGWDTTRARPYWTHRVVEDALQAGPPDFVIQLGDWVAPKFRHSPRPPLPADAAAEAWYAQNRNGPFAPAYAVSNWFHLLGNRENEGWPRDNEPGRPWLPDPLSLENTRARKLFFPNPPHGTPDPDLLSGNNETLEDYYDFVWGNIHGIVLNPYVAGRYGDIGHAQYAWLHDRLAQSQSKHVVVFAHYLCLTSIADPLTFGPYWNGGSEALNAAKWHYRVHQLCKRYGITAFVFGHVHRFSHSVIDGVHYVSVGVPAHASGSPFDDPGFSNGVTHPRGEFGYCEFEEIGGGLRMRWRRAALSFPDVDEPFNWSTDANGQRSADWSVDPTYRDHGAYGPLVDVQTDALGPYVIVPATTRAVRGVYRPTDVIGGGQPQQNFWRMPAGQANVFSLDFSQQQRVNLTGDPGVPQVHVDYVPYTIYETTLRRAKPLLPLASGDLDADGDLDLRDLAGFARCLTEAAFSADCRPADTHADGHIDLRDYWALAGDLSGPRPDLRRDLNGDGQIDAADLTTFIERFTGPFAHEAITPPRAGADADGDTDVDLRDYAALQRAAERD